jgi:anti-sigma B factor antagonist
VEIQEHSTGTVIVFALQGRLTLEPFGRLRDRVRNLVEQGGRHLVLDLSGVSYVDSIGVAELVRSQVIMSNQDGQLVLAELPTQISRLLQVTKLDQIFARFGTAAQAIEHIAQTDA